MTTNSTLEGPKGVDPSRFTPSSGPKPDRVRRGKRWYPGGSQRRSSEFRPVPTFIVSRLLPLRHGTTDVFRSWNPVIPPRFRISLRNSVLYLVLLRTVPIPLRCIDPSLHVNCTKDVKWQTVYDCNHSVCPGLSFASALDPPPLDPHTTPRERRRVGDDQVTTRGYYYGPRCVHRK